MKLWLVTNNQALLASCKTERFDRNLSILLQHS
jgi:hypothetical protein